MIIPKTENENSIYGDFYMEWKLDIPHTKIPILHAFLWLHNYHDKHKSLITKFVEMIER